MNINIKIAVAASGFRLPHICPFGKAVIAFSEDDGKSYSAPAVVIDTILDERDGGLCCFGESGLIFTSYNDGMQMQRKYIKGHMGSRDESVLTVFYAREEKDGPSVVMQTKWAFDN